MRLKRRSIESGSRQKPTILFSEVQTMKYFKMVPAQWQRLSRIDKKTLQYYRGMQAFYDDIANENARQAADRKNRMKRPR